MKCSILPFFAATPENCSDSGTGYCGTYSNGSGQINEICFHYNVNNEIKTLVSNLKAFKLFLSDKKYYILKIWLIFMNLMLKFSALG